MKDESYFYDLILMVVVCVVLFFLMLDKQFTVEDLQDENAKLKTELSNCCQVDSLDAMIEDSVMVRIILK